MRWPKHPVPMTTVFRRCLLVNYALAPDALAATLPDGLEPDVWHGRAWLSVVVGDLWRMRPAGVPAALGVSYRQIVYRAVVRCGERRGVYFLRSDADSRITNVGGNLMSFFHFHRAGVTWTTDGAGPRVRVASADGTADLDLALDGAPATELPPGSAFRDLAEAKDCLVDLYAAYHPRVHQGRVDVVRIRREDWRVTVPPVIEARCAYLDGKGPFPPGSARLDSVFAVRDLPYHWYRLQVERTA